MTKDQIDELMRENGIVVVGEAVYALCNLVEAKSAAAENEACAKVCENMCGPIEIYNPAYVHYVGCAEAIRARGQHD